MGISVKVQNAGLLTTIQDRGRDAHLASALSRGGAQDPDALEIANLLVGNAPDDAGLEITGLGPSLLFEHDAVVACFGAPVRAVILTEEKNQQRFPQGRPVVVPAGSTVIFSSFIRGFRAWIAFAGGIESPMVLSSRSSHLAGEIGPPRLQINSRIELGPKARERTQRIMDILRAQQARTSMGARTASDCMHSSWSIANHVLDQWPLLSIPAFKGRHFEALEISEQTALLQQEWRVSSRSNRQGLALEGRALITKGMPAIASEPVRFGTVQLPPGGKPFILMAEHQTTGGYPRVLEVASTARSLLAQASPESRLRFELIDYTQSVWLSKRQTKDRELTRFALEQTLA